jgi:aryl-alcohol dehydrogenase-like predicted oxidoreductase
MLYSVLGKSALNISKIAFGCMSLGENEQSNIQLLHRAIDSGINFFDTADLYQKGMNEEMLGRALQSKRKDVIIASKAGNKWRPDGSGWDWNPRKEYILQAAEKSLQRLQTDYIDLYQLHGGTLDDPIDETIEAFEQLVLQGKIRYYGISSIRPNVIREYLKKSRIISVMMQYSLLDRRPEEECLDLLKQHQVGVLARGSLAKGLLAGKVPDGFLNYTAAEVKTVATTIRKVSSNKRTPSQTAIQFVWHHPAITAAVIGIRTVDQLIDVADTSNTPLLSADEWRLLAGALPVNFYDVHQ